MKNIIKYIMGAAALLAAASCAKNVNWDEPVPGDGQPGISLQFTNSALTTKATVPGVNQENRVDRIRFFVFPATETQVTEGEGENATTKTVYTVADDAEYIFSGSYDGEDGNGWTYTAATESASEKWVYAKTMTAPTIPWHIRIRTSRRIRRPGRNSTTSRSVPPSSMMTEQRTSAFAGRM